MNRTLMVDGELHSIDIEGPDDLGCYTDVVGKSRTEGYALRVSRDQVYVVSEGRSVNLYVASDPAGTWVWVNGRARLVQDPDNLPRRRSSGPGETAGEITPPTPAGVVRILVQVGDAVDKRQPVVVVSAMKTEITLTAPHAGTVRAINAQVGAQVSPGDILVEIDPFPEDRTND
jgi:3-methylcrotonyl-CoA carboxylase alpha subunit